jgi:DNA-binding LytR/AlgR family response regulator
MTPLRAIIAEDEELMRHHLRGLVAGLTQKIDIVAEATDGGEAVALAEQYRPDLLLLDIHMPVLDGFAVVEKLMLGSQLPEIVFTTAYDRYALRAFDLNAAHYLLKPVSAERLATAIDRVVERLAKRTASTASAPPPDLQPDEQAMKKLLQSFRETQPVPAPAPRLTGLTSKVRDQFVVIPLDDILHISSDGGLNFIHTAKGKFLTDFTLDDLEQRLDPERFLRIYRGHIVALRHVRALVPWTEGKFEVILDDPAATRLTLSRYRLPEMRARLLW